jgi:hypothetical protein
MRLPASLTGPRLRFGVRHSCAAFWGERTRKTRRAVHTCSGARGRLSADESMRSQRCCWRIIH